MSSPFRSASCVAALAMVSALGRRAAADVPVEQCVAANTQSQALERQGKLTLAREQLERCVDASCPALVRGDCTQRLDQLEQAQPTIVFDARDGDGHDLAEVKVSVDGRPFADRLDGIALPVDPGEHAFTFEMAGAPPTTQRFVLRQGEKARRERIVLGPPPPIAGPPLAANPVSLPGNAEVSHGLAPQRLAALAALGVGVVGLGASAAFAMRANAKDSDSEALCRGGVCTEDGLRMNRDARKAGDLATVAFALGAVGIAGSLVLWFTGPPAAGPSAQVGISAGSVRLRGTW